MGYVKKDMKLQSCILDNRQQTTDNRQQTTDNRQQTISIKPHVACLGLAQKEYCNFAITGKKTLKKFFEKNEFDIVVVNQYRAIRLFMMCKKILPDNLSKIGIFHGMEEFRRPLRRRLFSFIKDKDWKIIGVSEAVTDYLIGSHAFFTRKNTLTIPNGIDVESLRSEALSREAAREFLGISKNQFVFGTIGRCVDGKRHLEFLKAFHVVAKKYENVVFLQIGDGYRKNELEVYSKDYGFSDKVILKGNIEQAAQLLKAMDVFVFPSEKEGFGLVLIEAMSVELPVIVNDIEPLNLISADGGLAVDTNNMPAFSQALEEVYSLSDRSRKKMGVYNLNRVKERYSIDSMINGFLHLLKKSVGSNEHYQENSPSTD